MSWMNEVDVYNKLMKRIKLNEILIQTDVVVVLFTAKGIDRNGLISDFYRYYEDAKHVNLPIEVVSIPMDETEEDFRDSFENQANWFTLAHGDPIIQTLVFWYSVTSIPHMIVMRPNGDMISTHGIIDLETHGKDALITWVSTTAEFPRSEKGKDDDLYGPEWKYCTTLKKPRARLTDRMDKLKLSK